MTYQKFLFVTHWTANRSCKAKVHVAVNCTSFHLEKVIFPGDNDQWNSRFDIYFPASI